MEYNIVQIYSTVVYAGKYSRSLFEGSYSMMKFHTCGRELRRMEPTPESRGGIRMLSTRSDHPKSGSMTSLVAPKGRRRRRETMMTIVALRLLLVGTHTNFCSSFTFSATSATTQARRRAMLSCPRCPEFALDTKLRASRSSGGGDASVATASGGLVADKDQEPEKGRRRKVVKPWLTRAQETVDYRNVEAMYVHS